MMGEDPVSAALAEKHIKEAAGAARKKLERLEKLLPENRQAYEKFHNNLALFAGGTIALSVTFLGYLKNLPNHTILFPRILVASWLILFVCLLTALFYSFFLSHYEHFSATGDYFGSLAKEWETLADAMDDLEFGNLNAQQKQTEQQRHRKIAGIYGEKRDSTKDQESRYLRLWIWCGRVARFAFLIGLGMLVLFAIKNM